MPKNKEPIQSKRDKVKGLAYIAGYEAAQSKVAPVRRIKWRDSRMFIEQEARDAAFEVAIIESVGFVIQEDRHNVVLAGDLLEQDVRRVIVIPKENIISQDNA